MDGRYRQIGDSYIVKSSCITIGKDKVGTGNFADVYKGTYRSDKEEKLVAVKIVRVGGGNVDMEMHCLGELKNEALIMSLHHHRCVIEFYGISSDKIPMILMEYCAGGSLDLHLQNFRERILTAERVLYMLEISDGMRYLERRQCVHRDLATRNVLISSTGCLKISDFGLSRSPLVVAPKESGHSHIPIRWMAPETLTRTPVYSSKSDIWSFAIVIFEIFSFGQKPWPEKPVKWIATKIRKGITAEMPKRMPRLIREISSACFRFEPEQRPTFKQVCLDMCLKSGRFNRCNDRQCYDHGSFSGNLYTALCPTRAAVQGNVNSRIRLVQSIRFPQPQPQKLTLARLKNVKPTKFIEKDLDEILVEIGDVKDEKTESDGDDDDKAGISRELTEDARSVDVSREEKENWRESPEMKGAKKTTESDDEDKDSRRDGIDNNHR